MTPQPPNHDYLDAFLQGSRFALFAIQARLRETGRLEDPELRAMLDEFHDLFQGVRTGVEEQDLGRDLDRDLDRWELFAPNLLGKN